MGKDYYKILGIERNASSEEVKKGYLRMARRYHPDKNNHPQAEDKFKEVGAAYENLSDELKRAIYDQSDEDGLRFRDKGVLFAQPTYKTFTRKKNTWANNNGSTYDASRGSGRGRFCKSTFFFTGIGIGIGIVVVAGYLTYKRFRSGKLEEIAKAASELTASDAAPNLSAYDAFRGSGQGTFFKSTFFFTGIGIGIVVAGYLMYKSCRSGNLEEIAKAASELTASDAAPNLSASTVGKISQATMEKTMAIVNWAFKWKDAASSLGSQLASTANTVGKISQAAMEKTINKASELKASDAASALGSQLASTANTVGKISQAAMEKTINKASELKASDAASALGSQLASSASTVGKIGQATMEKTMAIVNWAFKWKDSDAASSLGSQLASSASTVGKIGRATMEKTINKASELKSSDAASALGSQLASSASTVASASKDVLSKVTKWFQN
ncbi:uncharacterized protein [Drosophila kikkawai]|uniref:DnaJ homolog subfamily B member 9 n=1 Tax=Drosophila kikkawai TaxID=30033 RepID=A0A6P4J6G7_DROKI|nr:uncharacterized protein LOC108080660 [Drosophila kikkawai]